jgi:hypothetical protein
MATPNLTRIAARVTASSLTLAVAIVVAAHAGPAHLSCPFHLDHMGPMIFALLLAASAGACLAFVFAGPLATAGEQDDRP